MPFAGSECFTGCWARSGRLSTQLTQARERVARVDDPVALAFCLYYLASAVATARRLAEARQLADEGLDAVELSARELEVARLAARGMSNPAIADELFVSVATVKTHVSHILTKLGLGSRVQLAGWVAEHDPGPRTPAR